MGKLDIVCVGHLVYDIRDYVQNFPQLDKTVFMRMPPQSGPGGSAANVAMNCRKLNHTSGLVSNVGDDIHGKFLVDELRRRGVDKKEIRIVRGGRTGLSVILIDKEGQVMVIEDKGSVDAPRNLPAKYIANSRWVHLTGCEYSWLSQASKAAAKFQIPLSFDPGRAASRLGLEKLSPVIERTELLILNRKELNALTGSKSSEEIKHLSKEFDCTVILKTGHGPAIACQNGMKLYEVPPYTAPHVADTLGAGDAFASGVICGKLEGRSIYESIKMAHACAAAKVMHPGAQGMPKRREIRKQFKF
ncbi:MAG: carbohydrate kinase family protein [Candidatus Micrarchaeota archaeon]